MSYEPATHHRKSVRLQGYDYTQAGAYFVTVAAYGRMCCFGKLDGDVICLSQAGKVAEGEWQRLERRFPGVVIDEFTIMPNHIHGIILLPDVAATKGSGEAKVGGLSRIVEAKVEGGSPIMGAGFEGMSPIVGARFEGMSLIVGASFEGMSPIVGARQKNDSKPEVTLFASPLPDSPTPHGPRAGELGTIIGAYKSTTARLMNGINHTPRSHLWQRNYYEHIIRSNEDLDRIRVYIQDNPRRWSEDKENLWK